MDSPKRYTVYCYTCGSYPDTDEDEHGEFVEYEDYKVLLDKYEELQKDYEILGRQCTIANTKLIKIWEILR